MVILLHISIPLWSDSYKYVSKAEKYENIISIPLWSDSYERVRYI